MKERIDFKNLGRTTLAALAIGAAGIGMFKSGEMIGSEAREAFLSNNTNASRGERLLYPEDSSIDPLADFPDYRSPSKITPPGCTCDEPIS